jgi:hypothetical protein
VLIAILPSFFFGMFIAVKNDCIWFDKFKPIPVSEQNSFSVCSAYKEYWRFSYVIVASAILLVVVSILGDNPLFRKLESCKRKEENQVIYDKFSPV